jgi:N-acetylneuraminate synthase
MFLQENIGIKRPGTGVSPICYWDYIGKIADRDYYEDEFL